MKTEFFKQFLLSSFLTVLIISCSEDEPEPFFKYPLPDLIDPEVAARLTERIETENYIFYFARGDTVEPDRCEAYVKWALDYLDVTLPKKIEFYKFRSYEEMEEALGKISGGRAFPEEVAYATRWKWHNHEAMHVLSLIWSEYNYPPSFFLEGIAVAFEYDPYNDSWISRWNREEIDEPYIDIVKQLKAEERLYPIPDILESVAFLEYRKNEGERVAYPQAGMFTAFLIERYGLEKYRQVFSSIDYEASRLVISNKLQSIYNLSVEDLEQEWLEWLDGFYDFSDFMTEFIVRHGC